MAALGAVWADVWAVAVLAATSAASSASGASHARSNKAGGFDPSSTLSWSVPLILLAPFFLFVLVIFAVRYRRSSSNVALFAFLVSLAASLLVSWAQFNKSTPYNASASYLSLALSFQGAQRFQNFAIDVALRMDHLRLAALLVLFATGFVCLLWHRVGGREEQGPVRFHAAMLLLGFAAAGTIVSVDLVELFAFWGLAGVASYLLVAHRWGGQVAGRSSSIALWLPFGGDLALLSGLALLYSRYGSLNVDAMAKILHSTPGVGLKSLTIACILILAGIVVRAGLPPFHGWSAGFTDAPPAGLAFVHAVWTLLPAFLLYRSLPLFGGAGPQALRVAAYACLVGAALAPVLALIGNDSRRALGLAGAGAVAVGLFGIWQPAMAGKGFVGAAAMAGVLAIAPARAAAVLAIHSFGAALRTFDLPQMGGGWARLPLSTAALLTAVLTLAWAESPAAAMSARGTGAHVWWVFAGGLFAAAVAGWRVYVVVAHAPLQPRRRFEPARAREVAWQMAGGALFAGLLGVAGLGLAFFTRWLDFVEVGRHAGPVVRTTVLWLLPGTAGLVVSVLALGPASLRMRALSLSARAGGAWTAGWEVAGRVWRRFFAEPGPGLVDVVDRLGIGTGETEVGAALSQLGRLEASRVPALALVIALAVVGALLLGLVGQGVHR